MLHTLMNGAVLGGATSTVCDALFAVPVEGFLWVRGAQVSLICPVGGWIACFLVYSQGLVEVD